MSKKAIKTKEFQTLMNALENDNSTRLTIKNKYKKITVFLYFTGCRINEVCKLKTEDIHSILTTKKARVLTSKTARFPNGIFRDINFSDNAVKQIKKEFGDCLKHPKSYCIRAHNNKDKIVNITRLTNDFNKFLKEVLGDGYTSHSFRRGIITEMIIDKGVVPEVAQKFINHKNYSTTALYVSATEEDVINSLVR